MDTHSRSGLMWLDYVIFSLTVAVSLSIGLWQARSSQRTTSEYLMGDRRLRVLPVALSILVSNVSVITILGNATELHYFGASYVFFALGRSCAFVVTALVVVPLMHPLKLVSINEHDCLQKSFSNCLQYLRRRFDSAIVTLFGWLLQILNMIALNALVLLGPAVMIETMAGFPFWASMLGMAVVTTIYTSLGGLKAVIWTDVFQAVVITVGLLTVVIKGVMLAGGIGKVFSTYQQSGRMTLNASPSLFPRQTVWGAFVGGFLLFFVLLAFSQQGVQRYGAVHSLSDAKKCMWLAIIPQLIMDNLASMCGVVTYTYFVTHGCDPLVDGATDTPNQVLPYFVMEVLNYPGIPGLFVACVVCGSLSSLSSTLSAAAAITWNDVLAQRLSYLQESTKTIISKLLSLFFGVIILGCGFLFATLGGTIMQMCLTVIGSFQAPIILMFVLGGLVPRLNWKSVLIGGAVGLAVTAWLMLGGLTVKAHQQPQGMTESNCSTGLSNGNTTEAAQWQFSSPTNQEDVLLNELTTHGWSNTSTHSTTEIRGISQIYQISHNWISGIGILTGMLVAVLVSLLPGFNVADKTDPSLYFPCIRRLYMKKNSANEYNMVATKPDSLDQEL